MITFLSGGTGTPKLLLGFKEILSEKEMTVIVNTAEDCWVSGNHLSPDIDTLIYLFAGILNTDTWWGIQEDTFFTNLALDKMGEKELVAIGDQDRATHILRGNLLRSGERLTACTREICHRFGVQAAILPMTDTPVASVVASDLGEMHFQEFWVKHRGEVKIKGVRRECSTEPVATPEALAAVRESEAVVIGPSNPVTSILPILECRGLREALIDQRVIAISPFIGRQPVSGPAGTLMKAIGMKPSSSGTYDLYREFLPLFVQDIRDEDEVPGALRTDTLMTGREKSVALAEFLFKIINNIG